MTWSIKNEWGLEARLAKSSGKRGDSFQDFQAQGGLVLGNEYGGFSGYSGVNSGDFGTRFVSLRDFEGR